MSVLATTFTSIPLGGLTYRNTQFFLNQFFFESGIPAKGAQSFITTVAIQILSGHGIKNVMIGGVLAAIASVIDAIVVPLVREYFSRNSITALMVRSMSLRVGFSYLPFAGEPVFGSPYIPSNLFLRVFALIALNYNNRSNSSFKFVY
jgi:hypothetical protein